MATTTLGSENKRPSLTQNLEELYGQPNGIWAINNGMKYFKKFGSHQ